MSKNPPFTITNCILNLAKEIGHKLGLLAGLRIEPLPVKLRKENQIKTIQSTLSIEGNSLDVEQVQSILEGKVVIAPKKDLIEVKNAIALYGNLKTFNHLSLLSFKNAHKILMKDLIPASGAFRKKGIGIFKGNELAHIAPPANKVPELMQNLFAYLKAGQEISWLIKACVFHYELEFIHPFADGNGRMGRLWQQIILMRESPIFEFLSVEALIKASQDEYYAVLSQCDIEAESTKFIEYSLQQISTALDECLLDISGKAMGVNERLNFAKYNLGKKWFSRKEYFNLIKNISTATASRDLLSGVEMDMLEKASDKNKTKYRFAG